MKGIPLCNELKSLVLRTSDGLRLCHVRGDASLALRKVKKALEVREAHLASTLDLAELGVEPGTVSPFLDTLRSLPSIIDPSLMDLEYVSTNDGTRFGALYFAPVQLTLLPNEHLLQSCSHFHSTT
jgi:prolyl-tRNA editing enzyme YbaK/EbsC (Cys-tRNA(Pro) deacylase)